mgnify:CR=1 FL=1
MSAKPFKMTSWMWICVGVAAALLLFNVDPVGDMLNKAFGPQTKKWTVNIIITGLLLYCIHTSIFRKR